MSHWAEYLKETRGIETLETDLGFATYLFNGDTCYIQDIWVKPEVRKQHAASAIANEIKAIAIEKGSKWLMGTVNATFKDPTTSAKALLAYGFKIDRVLENVIVMKMEL